MFLSGLTLIHIKHLKCHSGEPKWIKEYQKLLWYDLVCGSNMENILH